MEKFKIEANTFLKKDVQGYYHTLYKKMSDPCTETLHINYLKDDNVCFSTERLEESRKKLYENLSDDLPEILKEQNMSLYICVVPRAKPEEYYKPSQLLFKKTIRTFVENTWGNDRLNYVKGYDGIDYIKRTSGTRTTHRYNPHFEYNSSEEELSLPLPYVGISKDTCTFSPEIKDKNILLIDDLYTYSVNIDEDMIQTLYDNGAAFVCFYSIGYLKY